MGAATVSPEDALAAYRECGTKLGAAEKLGVSEAAIRRALKKGLETNPASEEQAFAWSERDDTADLRLTTKTPIKTLDDLMVAVDIDWNIWAVDRWEATAWTTTAKLGEKGKERFQQSQNYRVAAKLKRKISQGLEQGATLLAKWLGSYKAKPLKPYPKQSGHMLEISLFDVHFGRAVWGGGETLKHQHDLYVNAGLDLLRKSRAFGIERIVLPVGQDLFQFDNVQQTTTNGTPQRANSLYAEMFLAGYVAVKKLVDEIQRTAPVEIVYVPGNHDRTISWHLCEQLKAHYENCARVSVDTEYALRKYVRHGKCLLALAHGNEEKHGDYSKILDTEYRAMLHEVETIEVHLGHEHKYRETRHLSADARGNVVVRVLDSLSRYDDWHYQKGFVTDRRAAQAFVWSESGLEAMLETRAA